MEILSSLFNLLYAFLSVLTDNPLTCAPVLLLCVAFLYNLVWRMVSRRYY